MGGLAGKVAGVIGTGKIGAIVARLLWHLRCDVVAYDLYPNKGLQELGVKYVSLDEVFERSQLITLNCPLTEETHHLVRKETIAQMRDGVMIVNTGRGPLIDTAAVVEVCALSPCRRADVPGLCHGVHMIHGMRLTHPELQPGWKCTTIELHDRPHTAAARAQLFLRVQRTYVSSVVGVGCSLSRLACVAAHLHT